MRYRENDIFLIPMPDATAVPGRVVVKLGPGNVLAAIYADISTSVGAFDVEILQTSPPIFLAETMAMRIKDGSWKIVGNWKPDIELPIPVYKTQFEFGGDFYLQEIDGSTGRRLTAEEAASLKKQQSYSPALIEQAARAFRGLDKWLPVFDDISLI